MLKPVTDLKALLRAVPADEPQAVVKAVAPLVAGSTVISLLQGIAQAPTGLPEGVSVSLYREALSTGSAPTTGTRWYSTNAIAWLPTASIASRRRFVRSGFWA